MLVFTCLVPHPPLILPGVGSDQEQAKVKDTIKAMKKLSQFLAKTKPEILVLSAPHPDWGFNVPLHFLAKDLPNVEVKTYLTDYESAKTHFQRGQAIANRLASKNKPFAWIASGDTSHRLKKDGPYGLDPAGKKFDRLLIDNLKKKDTKAIVNIDEELAIMAAECGWRSFCMALGALNGQKWQAEIISYEAPFGVGYLTANLKIIRQ